MEEKMLPHITNRIYHQQTPTHTMKNVKVGTSSRRKMIPDANLDLYNENGKWKNLHWKWLQEQIYRLFFLLFKSF